MSGLDNKTSVRDTTLGDNGRPDGLWSAGGGRSSDGEGTHEFRSTDPVGDTSRQAVQESFASLVDWVVEYPGTGSLTFVRVCLWNGRASTAVVSVIRFPPSSALRVGTYLCVLYQTGVLPYSESECLRTS